MAFRSFPTEHYPNAAMHLSIQCSACLYFWVWNSTWVVQSSTGMGLGGQEICIEPRLIRNITLVVRYSWVWWGKSNPSTSRKIPRFKGHLVYDEGRTATACMKPRVWSSAPHNVVEVVHACNLATWEVKTESSHVQGHHWFEESLNYKRLS